MTHSPEQLAFFEELQKGSSSISLRACAGAGKTSTIVYSTTFLPPYVLTRFLAFNKRIAEELKPRLPKHIADQTGTFHSCCNSALSRSLSKRPKILNGSGDKIHAILKANIAKYEDFKLYAPFVIKLVSLAKSAGLGTCLAGMETSDFQALINHHGLTLDSQDADEGRAIRMAQGALTESNNDLKSVDFDDMLYLALLRKVVFDKASFIFVDEAQDTNGVQRELLKAMGNFNPFKTNIPSNEFGSRLITVGDPHQAIYGFRGADATAMEAMENEFGMKKMYLSVSWRCSKAVVKEAQKGL